MTKIPLGDKGQFYLPDGVFITEQNEKQKLWIVELYNDKNVLRILHSLAKSAKAISLSSASNKYGLKVDPIILSAYTHKGAMESVVKALCTNENFAPVSRLFFFATLDDVKENCSAAWKDIYNNTLVFT